jgi:hypothetical protein
VATGLLINFDKHKSHGILIEIRCSEIYMLHKIPLSILVYATYTVYAVSESLEGKYNFQTAPVENMILPRLRIRTQYESELYPEKKVMKCNLCRLETVHQKSLVS